LFYSRYQGFFAVRQHNVHAVVSLTIYIKVDSVFSMVL